MTTKHTPGPWTENACEIQAADDSAICEMLARPEDTEKWGYRHADANSRLICSAPDLLAALEDLISTFDIPTDAPGPCWDNARAAISKAKGGAA